MSNSLIFETLQAIKKKDCQDLYIATLKGDWETAKRFLDKDRSMLHVGLTFGGDTVIQVATNAKCTPFVKEILEYMTAEELVIGNFVKDVPLHNAAASGVVEIAELLVVQKNNNLPMFRGFDDFIPFGTAKQFGHKAMAQYLFGVTNFDHLNEKERSRLFFNTLSCDMDGMTTFFFSPRFDYKLASV